MNAIPTNTIALATLVALMREAEIVEKENDRVTSLVQRVVSKGGTSRRKTGRAQMLMAPASRPPRGPPHRNREGKRTDVFNNDQQEGQSDYSRSRHFSEYRGTNQATAYQKALATALGQIEERKKRGEARRSQMYEGMEEVASQVKTGFALLSIAKRAMRDASSMNAPLSCWGCVDPHLFSQCPLKNDPTVIAPSERS
jgi:hypothetical protein